MFECRLHKYRRVVVNSLDGQAPVSCIFCICVFVSVVFWYLCLCVLSADCVQAKVGQGRVGARVDYLVGQAPLSLSSMTWPHQLTALPPPLHCFSCTHLCTAQLQSFSCASSGFQLLQMCHHTGHILCCTRVRQRAQSPHCGSTINISTSLPPLPPQQARPKHPLAKNLLLVLRVS